MIRYAISALLFISITIELNNTAAAFQIQRPSFLLQSSSSSSSSSSSRRSNACFSPITTTTSSSPTITTTRIHSRSTTQQILRLAAVDGGGGDGEGGGDGQEPGGFAGTGLSPWESAVTLLGINPITILMALVAIGMVSANAILGPGWLRPAVGLKPTTFQARNLVLPLDQPGFIFPKTSDASTWTMED